MSIPVTVIVPHISSRDEWFKRFCLPSIEANEPSDIFVIRNVSPASRARNQGRAMVMTPYVIFVDDDHVLGSDCLKLMVEALECDRNASFAYCQYIGVDTWGADKDEDPNHRRVRVLRQQAWDPRVLKQANYIDICSLVRTTDCPKFDEDVQGLEDWDLWLQMAKDGKRGTMIPKMLYYKFCIDEGVGSQVAFGKIKTKSVYEKWGLR